MSKGFPIFHLSSPVVSSIAEVPLAGAIQLQTTEKLQHYFLHHAKTREKSKYELCARSNCNR